ncbi:bifunctional 3-dehydroquinate dehydratase/shikimate dehydrogenase, chloroplastic-like isoform X1 [Pistacia vera]|uniref:bifunctional 3-dehydroquinate dehydratase/shikimate dehydrogenase, chloroplastic-like isoform X1 n=1 Tax=Pistacia vera TaxID=55513 RepID=UPI0012634397|nr:bifunctional 3-dehydroquinate dehydratase/shikimate dehydrogenase, chloroplastic-like isoform X1 [Pistacia vera]
MGSLPISENTTMICAPLMVESAEQMVSDMDRAKAEGADIVELRLDFIRNFQPRRDLEIILKNKPLPVLIVYRPKWAGGQYEGDEQKRLEALHIAEELGADYVDFELKVASDFKEKWQMRHQSDTKFVVSHYLGGITPSIEDLNHLVARMEATGADFVKLIASVTDITEIARIFQLISHCQVPTIAYSVGERGFMSQILSPKYGVDLVYGSLAGNPDPGLPTIESLVQTYNVKHIDADTTVFGLISKPVSHSKGPLLHNPTFRYVNFNGIYVPMFVDDLKSFFCTYSRADFAGFSVGFPYKEAVTEFCDELHPPAQSIGAVNTIIRRPSDGKLIGYNTDCEASITAIEDAIKEKESSNGKTSFGSPLAGKLFVLAGAGGAGRALAFGAKSRGARIVIFDIDFDRAKSLASAVLGEARLLKDIANFRPEKGAILANATPLGMHPNTDRIPVAEETLQDYQLVFDAVYIPRKTRLLKDAEAAGAITVSGVEMFLRQAIGQFNLFTNGEAPKEFMREIVFAKF